MVLISVGIVVLNSSVTGTAGANPVPVVVVGVLVPTMLVSACWELLSRLSVDDMATVKGSPHEEVELLCALLRPSRESMAEVRRVERRILVVGFVLLLLD
jgi:hypothetical protein